MFLWWPIYLFGAEEIQVPAKPYSGRARLNDVIDETWRKDRRRRRKLNERDSKIYRRGETGIQSVQKRERDNFPFTPDAILELAKLKLTKMYILAYFPLTCLIGDLSQLPAYYAMSLFGMWTDSENPLCFMEPSKRHLIKPLAGKVKPKMVTWLSNSSWGSSYSLL